MLKRFCTVVLQCTTSAVILVPVLLSTSASVSALPLKAEQLNNQPGQIEESVNSGQTRTLSRTCFAGCGGSAPGGVIKGRTTMPIPPLSQGCGIDRSCPEPSRSQGCGIDRSCPEPSPPQGCNIDRSCLP